MVCCKTGQSVIVRGGFIIVCCKTELTLIDGVFCHGKLQNWIGSNLQRGGSVTGYFKTQQAVINRESSIVACCKIDRL